MKKNKKIIVFPKQQKKKRIMLILVLIMLITFIIAGESFAKYQSIVTGNIFAKIAKPIIELEAKKVLNMTLEEKDKKYEFEVKNYNEKGEINEAVMDYYIEIIPHVKRNIIYKLYKQGEEIELKENKTAQIELPISEEIIHSYQLEVKSNEEKTETESIEVKVKAIQRR